MKITQFVIATILSGYVALSQTNTGNVKQTGSCNAGNSGNNSTVTVTCTGIGKEQGDKIIKILNAALAQGDLVNAKLDQLIDLANKPVQILNCVGSNCVQGGTQNNYDNRTYGTRIPPPAITGFHAEALPSSPIPTLDPKDPDYSNQLLQQSGVRKFDFNRGTQITFTVVSDFFNPMFAIWCDRPCVPTQTYFFTPGGGGSWNGSGYPFLPTNSPNIWVSLPGNKNVMRPGEYQGVIIRSRNDQPISITHVEGYVQ
jgi:hypothetical protein